MTDTLFLERKKVLANRTILVKVKGKVIADTSVFTDYYESEKIEIACKEGCSNYGNKWSCPPYSKAFLDIEKKYSKAFLLCFSTEMNYYSDVKNMYLAVKAANVTLKTLIERCARSIEEYTNGYSLLSGSCRLCKPCQCKNKHPCKHPDKMRYSMEATGLNVQKVCFDFLKHRLLWYKNKKLPQYTSVVILILSNQYFNMDELLGIINKTLEG